MMSMSRFTVLLLLFISSMPSTFAATAEIRVVRHAPYVYCNVYAADACFGIAKDDRLTMAPAIDFVVYEVSFSFGRTAVIYSGFNPRIGVEPGSDFKPCAGSNGFAECRRRELANGGVEFVASRDQRSAFLHIVISKGKADDLPKLESFLANVRACTYDGDSVTCAP
jgi:hypothetical protein